MNEYVLYLVYPAIVAILSAFLSYYATSVVALNSKKKETEEQRVTLIDNLILRLNKLVATFDALNSDIETRNFFALTTTNKAQKVVNALNGYLWNVYLLENPQHRTQIVEAVENADELVNEINSLENYPFSEESKAESKKNEINREFRELKVRLINEGVVLDDNLKATFVSKKNKDTIVLETVNAIISELDRAIGEANDNFKSIVSRNEKRRPLIATKIVDQKTKVRDLLLTLQNLRSK